MPLVKKVSTAECVACRLHKTRRNIVPGRGKIPADICFIGEAPGTSDDLLGEAFIGPAGKLLDAMIIDAEVTEYTAYFTNCVFCRPTEAFGAANREPLPDEVLACSKNVFALLDKVRARVFVLVGKHAETYFAKHLTGPIVTIQHPSFLLRSGGKASPYYMSNIKRLREVLRCL